MSASTVIVGLGSTVMGDDGIGPRLVSLLEERCTFPDTVELVDCGTPGLGLMSYIIGYEKVILIDAVHDEGEAGTVRVYGREEILSRPLPNRVSPHDPAVAETLLTADMLGQPVSDVWLIGVIPEDCGLGTELSPALALRLEEIFRTTLDILHANGIHCSLNSGPCP